jgi:dienelactone hydrolase
MNMRRLILTCAVLALIGGNASAGMVERKIGYEIDGKAFQGVLVYDDGVTTKRPAILMEPDWSGVSSHSVELAREIAGRDYVVFVADLFGVGYAPKDAKERAAATTAVHADVNLMRARGGKGFDVLLTEGERLGIVDPAKIVGIGFCFGGGVLLEVAREGRDFKALTVFHVTNPQPADPAGPSKIKVQCWCCMERTTRLRRARQSRHWRTNSMPQRCGGRQFYLAERCTPLRTRRHQ